MTNTLIIRAWNGFLLKDFDQTHLSVRTNAGVEDRTSNLNIPFGANTPDGKLISERRLCMPYLLFVPFE